jgi:hypothetical protein
MAIHLGWNDLLIQNLRMDDCQKWLSHWSDIVSGRVAPVYMSKFGDWFLRHPDGSTSELSVIEGTYSKIASTPDGFMALVNSQQWQEEHLLSLLVYQLQERQTIPADGQCYGFAPHPRLSGRIDVNQAMIVEIGAWQAICAAAIALKPGTRVEAVRIGVSKIKYS